MRRKYDYTIIGAGPMGLSLSLLLSKKGYVVRLLDSNKDPGGHARPFKFSKVLIEIFYHFFYKNDHFNALDWINETKASNKITWKKINTSILVYVKKKHYFINPDSVYDLIKNFGFHFFAIVIGFIKIKFFSKVYKDLNSDAYAWSNKIFGKKFSSYVWVPLLKGKFGKKWKSVSSLWLLTRIKRHLSTKDFFSRKSIFGYLNNSYLATINNNIFYITKRGSKFFGNFQIEKIKIKNNKVTDIISKNKIIKIDKNEKVISTIPLFVLKKLFKNYSKFKYLKKFKGIGVIVCILKMNKKISNCYWTSISDSNCPFNAIIQQNRLYPKSKHEIVYTSKYLDINTIMFSKNENFLKKSIINTLIKFYPHIDKKNILDIKIIKSSAAAPIPTLNTINTLPNFKSPIDNFWHGGLEYIYPEDRGVGNSILVSKKLFEETVVI